MCYTASTTAIRHQLQPCCLWACFKISVDPPIQWPAHNFCKFPAANALNSLFWLWLQLLLDFFYLTHWGWSLPSDLSQRWDSATFSHALPKRKKYTYTNWLETLCLHQIFLKLWRDRGVLYCYHASWFPHPPQTLLIFGRGLPFAQETKFPLYYSEQLSSPCPFLWHPMTHTWSHPHCEPSLQVPRLISTEDQKEVLKFTLSAPPFCTGEENGMIFSPYKYELGHPSFEHNWLESILVF